MKPVFILVLVSADLETDSSSAASSGLRSGFGMRPDLGESQYSLVFWNLSCYFSERGCLVACATRECHDTAIYIIKRWMLFFLWAVISVFAAYHTISMTVWGAARAK